MVFSFRYGIPFPVLARAAYGIRGANFPALSRALVAAGWFGIQTSIGGGCLHQLLTTAMDAWPGIRIPAAASAIIVGLEISTLELTCFLVFWSIQVGRMTT